MSGDINLAAVQYKPENRTWEVDLVNNELIKDSQFVARN